MKAEQTGIYTEFNGEPIGFTPIEDNRLADACYYLYERLTHEQYNHFENELHSALDDEKMSGTIEVGEHVIRWELTI